MNTTRPKQLPKYDETKTAAENRRVEVYMYASEEMIQQAEAQS